jgi:hypothetical protein
MAAMESLVALVLQVGLVLLTDLGIYGIAIGTALPTIVVSNLWLFIVTYRKVGASPLAAAKSTTLRWVAGSILFAVPCVLVSFAIPHGSWLLFWLKVGIVSILYLPIGLFVVLRPGESLTILARMKSLLPWGADPLTVKEAPRGSDA